ncbi:hypothetical protein [Microlunatus flavus]|uniref:MT0933-like antitoxin protein n=1 Tax=Microlunatus flavus TaxID=1036181 RepID=A0A1H9LU02_9ACTN|nr:hypothetical protein [Microlunatus flavus]SER14904.1 hypothetical protein SAMN05421756_109116 [Microlunatus flavus]
MGILDDLKHKAEALGEKAREGLDVARDKAGDLVDDVKERVGQHEGDHAPTGESSDIGPDSSSTDAVQPGYVTGEDDVVGAGTGEDALDDETDADEAEADPDAQDPAAAADDAVVEEEALVAEPDSATTTETDAADADGAAGSADALDTVDPAGAEGVDHGADASSDDAGDDATSGTVGDDAADEAPLEPLATEVDPYDEPLSESIGAELSDADREALTEAVEGGSSGRPGQDS